MTYQTSSFPLLEGEKIISEPHLHWSWILPILLKATFASAFFASIAYLAPSYFFETVGSRVITLVFVVSVIGYVVGVRKKHQLSRFIITSYRLIDIDRSEFFHSQVCEIPYDHIQSVRTSMSGFWGTIFRYGTLIISTAGEESQFESHHLAHLREVQSIILTARDEFLRNLGVYNNTVMDQSGTMANQMVGNNPFMNFFKAMQMAQPPFQSESKPLVGFTVNDDREDLGRTMEHSNSSYLVGMLSRGGGFKKNVIQSLVEEIDNDGRPRGHRLVKTITSSPHFKKKVMDDLAKEILN